MKKTLKWIMLVWIGVILTSCGARLTKKIHQVKQGMPRAEVQKLLGKPNQIGLARMATYDGVADFYEEKDSKITVIYKEDKAELILLNQEVMKFGEKAK